MKALSISTLIGRFIFGVCFAVALAAIVYGLIFAAPFVVVGIVAAMTFGICNIPLYLGETQNARPIL